MCGILRIILYIAGFTYYTTDTIDSDRLDIFISSVAVNAE